jgi:hypothetical protein
MALLLAALFVEVGFVLLIVPWSILWDRNYFIDVIPQLQAILTSNYVRGAVSGLGAVNIGAGIAELVAIFAARARGTSSTNSEFRIQNSETPLR